MLRGTLANQNWQCFTSLFPLVGGGCGGKEGEWGDRESR